MKEKELFTNIKTSNDENIMTCIKSLLGYRLRQFSIYVGNTNGPSTPFDVTKYEVCAKMCHEQLNKGKYYSCKETIRGRHVAVEHHQISLSLCEIEVYTDAIEGRYIQHCGLDLGFVLRLYCEDFNHYKI